MPVSPHHERELKRRDLAVTAVSAAVQAVVTAYVDLYHGKQPYNTSALSGKAWLQEIYNYPNPHKMQAAQGFAQGGG